MARELGVTLSRVNGSGPKERILKEDVHQFVKTSLQRTQSAPTHSAQISALPVIDFKQWGEIEEQPMPRLQAIAAKNLHANWVTIPHVTQFDEADITELEKFRNTQKEKAKVHGIRLTPPSIFIESL